MEQQQQQQHPRPPPAYSHDPDTFFLPPVPTQDPRPSRTHTVVHLPKLESLHLLPSQQNDSTWHVQFPSVPTGNVGSPITTDGTITPEDTAPTPRPASIISIDDPDVRIAAEAMCEISKSPGTRSIPPINTQEVSKKREREPLLRLITTSHPWLGTTINGSLTAYAFTKNYGPRVVRDSAEYIERNIGTPVANTVSTVGRRTGMESGLRRYLGEHRRPSDLEAQDEGSGKRRRIEKTEGDEDERGRTIPIPLASRVRNDSQSSYAESLPAYDDNRSPTYEEVAPNQAVISSPGPESDQRVNWSTQLIMTTSGLGAALHKESLEKLKYCMSLLRHFSEKLGESMEALKKLLIEYEDNTRSQQDGLANGEVHGNGANQLPEAKEARLRQLADQMKELGSTIWKMLHHVMQSVIQYTWGALPDNASRVVRGQVLSAPERWRRIQHTETGAVQGTAYEATATHHMLAFAKESLEMMAQVSAVIGGTIQSAEAWLDRMGRNADGTGAQPVVITEPKKQEVIMFNGTNGYPAEKV